MPIRRQRPGPNTAPEWKRAGLSEWGRDILERRLSLGELVARNETKREKRPRFRLEVEARNNGSRDPLREAVAEATREERDPFGALVDLAERLQIDVVLLLTATIATELVRRDPTLKARGRPALDSTDACYLLFMLEAFKRAAEEAASDPHPVDAAMASFGRAWHPVRPEDRAIAEALASKIKGRGRAALSVALEVLRAYEPDLVGRFVGKRSGFEAKKRLRELAERDTDRATEARWLELKKKAASLLNAGQ